MAKDVKTIKRISIDLFQLKPLEDLRNIYLFYKKSLTKFFDEQGQPRPDFFEIVDCPICHNKKFARYLIIDNFEYRRCDNCLAVYNSPRLKFQYIEEMYSSGEYLTYFTKLVVKSQKIRKNIIEQRKFEQCASFFNQPGKVLDVGCGSGSLLKVFQENGWRVFGLDPSVEAVKTAKELYQIDIWHQGFENFQSTEKFDCITFWGLEHLPDPLAGLEKAKQLLGPQGIIVFESPSADCLLMRYLRKNLFSPYRFIESARHVLFFSKKSLRYICEKYNLQLAYLESNGLDLQTIFLDDLNEIGQQKAMKIQKIIDEKKLADHYRVFLKLS